MASNRPLVLATLLLSLPYSIFAQGTRTTWPDEVANDVLPGYTLGLEHGPMLGQPTSHSMRVWIKTDTAKTFEVVYSQSLPLPADAVSVVGRTLADDDYTGHVTLDALAPDTKYYYGIRIDNKLADIRKDYHSAWPSFRTLPDNQSYHDPDFNPKGHFNFEFGVGACNRQGGGRFNDPAAYYSMMRTHPDLSFFVMNGDYIYEHYRTKENLPHTIDLFRKDYQLYMERAPGMTWMMRNVPFVFQYDDHESFSDLEGTGEIGLKDGKWLYRDRSLKPYYEYAGWANFDGPQHQPTLYGTAELTQGTNRLYDPQQQFDTLSTKAISNIHVSMGQKNAGVYALEKIIGPHQLEVSPAFEHDETAKYSVGSHHYYDWQVDNCHFFAIDIRSERTQYKPEKAKDPDRWLLGETQKKWLMDGISSTDADFVFIVSTVSWMMYHTNFHMYASGLVAGEPTLVNGRSVKEDGFTGALHERDALLRFFDDVEKPVVILTGDLHNAYVLQVSDNVWECLIAPLNSGNHNLASAGNPPMGGWFDSEGWPVKIKWVSSFPNQLSFLQLRNNYYGVISVNNIIKSAQGEEAGYHFIAYDEPQIVVQLYDAYTGKLVYAEGISTLDAKFEKSIVKPSVK